MYKYEIGENSERKSMMKTFMHKKPTSSHLITTITFQDHYFRLSKFLSLTISEIGYSSKTFPKNKVMFWQLDIFRTINSRRKEVKNRSTIFLWKKNLQALT